MGRRKRVSRCVCQKVGETKRKERLGGQGTRQIGQERDGLGEEARKRGGKWDGCGAETGGERRPSHRKQESLACSDGFH